MCSLSEQRNLLARIEQPADGENRIVFASVWIKENRIAPVVDDLFAISLRVAGMDHVEHPLAGSNDDARFGESC